MREPVKEGTRVHIFSGDLKTDLGYGIIEKVEPLRIEETGLTISSAFPSRIVLDSGEVTDGLHCWWSEAKKGHSKNE